MLIDFLVVAPNATRFANCLILELDRSLKSTQLVCINDHMWFPINSLKFQSVILSWSTWQSMNVGYRNATSLPGHWQNLCPMINVQTSKTTLLFAVLHNDTVCDSDASRLIFTAAGAIVGNYGSWLLSIPMSWIQ